MTGVLKNLSQDLDTGEWPSSWTRSLMITSLKWQPIALSKQKNHQSHQRSEQSHAAIHLSNRLKITEEINSEEQTRPRTGKRARPWTSQSCVKYNLNISRICTVSTSILKKRLAWRLIGYLFGMAFNWLPCGRTVSMQI